MLFMILRILVSRAFNPYGFIQAKGLNLVVGLHVRAVSVFEKKSTAVGGFLAYFCAVLRFSDAPYSPLRSFGREACLFYTFASTIAQALGC